MTPVFSVFIEGISGPVVEFLAQLPRLPEFQSLEHVTENNPWHNHQAVADHATQVFENLQNLLQFEWMPSSELRLEFTRFVSQHRDQLSRLSRIEQLLLACAFHDLGKGSTRPSNDPVAPGQPFVLSNPDGTTKALGHESESARITQQLMTSLVSTSWFSETDLKHVVNLVAKHDTYSYAWCQTHLEPLLSQPASFMEQLRAQGQPYALELLLHITADEWGVAFTTELRNQVLELVAANASNLLVLR